MSSTPDFCQYCGNKLQPDPNFDESWQSKLLCTGCGASCVITYGDAMGGGSDHQYWTKGASKGSNDEY